MAKETKTATEQAAETTTVNVDNLIEKIENGTKFDEELTKKAEQELKDEKDKQKVEQLKQLRCQADYTINRELLKLRKNRDQEEVIKKAVKVIGELRDKVSKGEITPMAYEDEVFKAGTEKNKSLKEIDEKYRKLIKQLKDNYPRWNVSDWEYENWTEAGRDRWHERRYNF